ncbi:MAG TPA: pectinesterase family protein [Opitutaceae bacterium]|nr:pectinesterase family protein [Opitutaceae bacterium]
MRLYRLLLTFAGFGFAIAAQGAGANPPIVPAVAAPSPIRPDLTVAADGSGDFKTIQEALDAIAPGNRERMVIFIKDGVYHEKIRIDPACITLRGQSRQGARIEFAQGAEEFRRQPDDRGIGVVNINGNDCVLENLTVQNTHGVIGVHAFAVYGRADRIVIVDCDVLSDGNDTLSLWPGGSGRFYHARLKVRGSVDFVCPRGWCYMTDCNLYEVNPRAEAAIWHDGSKNPDMKFVLRRCRFDGVDGWRLARHHHDAQFFLLDCTFSQAMRDLAPRRVIYPLDGGPPTEASVKRNRELDPSNQWGERAFYHNCHRVGGDYAWFRDNLASAPGAPRPGQITAAWTFAGTWDPERTGGPVIRKLERRDGTITLTFSEGVTVKGRPRLLLRSGSTADYVSGSGSDTLAFAAPAGPRAEVSGFDPQGGAIVASEAAATLRAASLALP